MKHDLSAIIVTYGRHDLLCEALGSIQRQRNPHGRVELFILNDHERQELIMTEETRNLFPEWLDIRIENHPRYRNLGAKYNTAVDLAQSDFICMIDDDDLSLPWKFEQMLTGKSAGIHGTNPMIRRATEGNLFWQDKAYYLHWNYAFRKNILEKIGVYQEPPESPDMRVALGLNEEMTGRGIEHSTTPHTFYRSAAGKYQTSKLQPEIDGLNDRIDAALGEIQTGTIEIFPKLSREQAEADVFALRK